MRLSSPRGTHPGCARHTHSPSPRALRPCGELCASRIFLTIFEVFKSARFSRLSLELLNLSSWAESGQKTGPCHRVTGHGCGGGLLGQCSPHLFCPQKPQAPLALTALSLPSSDQPPSITHFLLSSSSFRLSQATASWSPSLRSPGQPPGSGLHVRIPTLSFQPLLHLPVGTG